MTDVWAPLQYGWGHLYWLTIEGVPVAFSQASSGKTAPPDHPTEDPTLVLADSARVGAVVDRDRGVAAGFPLTFRLLDSPTVAGYMVRPSASTYLTASLSSSGGTVTVESAADFDASGSIYIGKERIAYSAKGASSFTVAASGRGKAGYAYPHSPDSAGAIVTDTPRYWSGRLVTLYASPMDPTGYVTGTNLDDDAVAVWRGYIAAEPLRASEGDGFVFEALPLDRMLARPLSGVLTGTITDLEPRFPLADRDCMISVEARNGAGAQLFKYVIKFEALPSATVGDLVSITEWNASAVSEFATAITTYSAGSDLVGLDIVQATSPVLDGAAVAINKGDWVPILRFAANSNIRQIELGVSWAGSVANSANALNSGPIAVSHGFAANEGSRIGVAYSWSPYQLTANGGGSAPLKPQATIRFDQGYPGTLPDSGAVTIGDAAWTYAGTGQTADAGTIVLQNLAAQGHSTAPAELIGATAEVRLSTTGNLADTVRRILTSSGESGLRDATYDTLPGQIGYGLPSALVDLDTIGDVLAEGWLSGISLDVMPSDESLADICGPLMALSQRALTVTDDADGIAKLSAIHTSSAAGGYAATVSDNSLITHPQSSVELERVQAPNVITVELKVGEQEHGRVVQTDAGRVAWQGAQTFDATIPSADREVLVPLVAAWGISRIAGDQHAAMMSADVVPWTGLRVGDAVDVSLTHPGLWDWSAGAVGYTGRGRVLGREVTLSTGVTRLHIVIDGQSVSTALCPAAPVSAFTGTAANPTTIDIPAGFYTEIQRALTAAGTDIRLLHYEPGEGSEGVSEAYTISAAQVTAGVCRLTVASVIGSPTLSTSTSYLTWPETANASAYQATFAHDGDGTRWA